MSHAHLAIAFLARWKPGGPWVLTAIAPDRKRIETMTFQVGAEPSMAHWIAERDGKANLYFQINPAQRDLDKKAQRRDIKEVRWLHVDLDARAGEELEAERTRILGLLTDHLPKGVPPPTAVVDSGGGYWGFWRLAEPIQIGGELARAEDAKRYNQQLEMLFGADNCHNIDRIARLPGTANIPDAKKLAKGRRQALAALVEFHDDRVYPLGVFTPAPAVQMPGEQGPGGGAVRVSSNVQRLAGVDDLDRWSVPDRVKVIIVQGRHPDEPKQGDNSRSAWVFDACCQLVRFEVPDEVIFSILTDKDFGISESILEKGSNAERYALRQIEQARSTVALDASEFQASEKGLPYPNRHNIRVALWKLGVRLSHDLFADRIIISGLPGHGPELDDAAIAKLWLLVEEKFGFRPGREFFQTCIEVAARDKGFHPVRDYLDGLAWDRTPRLDLWLVTYGGAMDSPLVRAVGSLMLIAAVRRVRDPGCKFDEMLVLESDQGTDKSSALAILAVREEWFGDDLPLNGDSKRVIEALAGCWIVEAAELKGMRRGDVEHLKALLSRRVDRARLAYGRLPVARPRQCVIFGTTNSAQYLRDGTGNRRFWPVRVSRFDLAALRRDRDQLWAEAAAREAAEESIRLDPALYGAAADAQEERRVEDPFVGRLASVLGDLNGKLAAEDAWLIVGVPTGQRTQDHNARLGEAMRSLGYERVKLRIEGRATWCYARGSRSEREARIVVRCSADGSAWAELEGSPREESF
jgi:hypothetical protein